MQGYQQNRLLKRLLNPIIVCGLFFSIVACQEQPIANTPEDEPPRPVKSMVITSSDLSSKRRYPGVVAASQKVPLAFQVAGQLIEFPAKKGFVVKQNELLGQLDPRDYQHDLDEEMARYTRAKTDYERFAELIKTGSISKTRYDEQKSEYKVAEARVAAAQKALDDTRLRAPFAGIVADTFVENYQNVQAKEVVLQFQDISTIEIIINVPERDFFQVEEDISQYSGAYADKAVALVTFDSLPGQNFPVSLKEFTTSADAVTQTYEITFVMPKPANINIFPGMSATVIPLDIEQKSGTYEVPVSAVFADEKGNSYVWLISPETTTVHKQPVTIGSLVKNKIVVLDGLQPGDEIVTAGVSFLHEDTKVLPQPSTDSN